MKRTIRPILISHNKLIGRSICLFSIEIHLWEGVFVITFTQKVRLCRSIMFKLLLSAAAALVLGLYLAQNTDVFSYFFKKSEKLFTAEQLNKFDGTQQHPELYLAIMGIVYNVTEGLKHYGPGETYHGFVGKVYDFQCQREMAELGATGCFL